MSQPEPVAVLEPTMIDTVVEPVKEPVTPAVDPAKDPAPVVDPAAPLKEDPAPPSADQLFELPDGRKVDAAGLATEYKNLLSDYTPKAQKLAEYEKVNKPPVDNTPEWKKPGYQPQSWAEAIEIAKKEAINELANAAQQEEARVAAIATEVNGQIAALRVKDPQLDENALFLHANKYGFRDLAAAYGNMKDLQKIAVDTEARVLKNIKGRGNDVVSTQPGIVVPSDAIDPNVVRSAGSALEFLQRLKK